jgi:hypothetical protein
MVRASLVISVISLILIFLLELTARLIFPEFKGHIHSSQTTLGQRFFMSKDFPIRIPSVDHTLKFERPLVIVLGDSISHGYGMAYEDIYWVRLQERLNLRLGDQAPEIVSLSYGGNNLNDSQLAIKNFLAMPHPLRSYQILSISSISTTLCQKHMDGLHFRVIVARTTKVMPISNYK